MHQKCCYLGCNHLNNLSQRNCEIFNIVAFAPAIILPSFPKKEEINCHVHPQWINHFWTLGCSQEQKQALAEVSANVWVSWNNFFCIITETSWESCWCVACESVGQDVECRWWGGGFPSECGGKRKKGRCFGGPGLEGWGGRGFVVLQWEERFLFIGIMAAYPGWGLGRGSLWGLLLLSSHSQLPLGGLGCVGARQNSHDALLQACMKYAGPSRVVKLDHTWKAK